MRETMKNLPFAAALFATALAGAFASAQRERSAPSLSEIVVTKATDSASTSPANRTANAELINEFGTDDKYVALHIEPSLLRELRAAAATTSGTGKTLSAALLGKDGAMSLQFRPTKRSTPSGRLFLESAPKVQKLTSLTLWVPNREDRTYLEIKLQDVKITSYQTSGSSGDTIPLSINFTKIEFKTTPMGARN